MTLVLTFLTLVPCSDPLVRFRSTDESLSVVATIPESAIPGGAMDRTRGESILRVSLLSVKNTPGEPLLGSYSRSGAVLTFTPRFPLAPGCRYRAELILEGKSAGVAEYAVPESKASEPPRVEAIYPSTDVVPANLLKFYIHFSKPMREGPELFDRIHILDEKGKPVEDPWRRTELWNDDATRLTIWIHPGRTKQGVNLREDFGPVLVPDRKYTLVLDASLVDDQGKTLAKAVTKSFRTSDPARAAIDIDAWKVQSPMAGTRESLVVAFPHPLDRLLLDSMLKVRAEDANLAGEIAIGKDERSWRFTPAKPWRASRHSLQIAEKLEDLAGNTPLRAFDFDRESPAAVKAKLSIAFQPK